MPKSKEYVSSSSGSDEEKSSKTKSKKAAKRQREESPPPPKKASKESEDGEYKFQLSKMRFATVSEFRGKVMVGIREYYEKDGKTLPGRKGISLNMEQWNKLKDNIDDIDDAIKKF